MAQRSSNQSHSDNSLIRSATSYRESDGSGLVSGIMATRSVDSDDDDNNNYAELSVNSDLQNNPQMISGRGALISGMSVPSFDSEEEIEFEGGLEDLESGFEPPDSDYASRAPPQLFPKTTYERNEVNLMTMDAASDLSGKSESRTEQTEGPPELHIDDRSLNIGKPRRRKVFWYTFIFITLLMIGSVIAVAIVLANKEKLTPVQQEISDIVTTISGQDVVANKYSPQRKAYTWMVHEDKMFADKTVPLNRDAVVQRYVLAVFYFATNGQLWSDNNWLKGGECSDMWTGLKCNNQDQVLAISLDNQGLSGTIPGEIGHLSNMENFVVGNEDGLNGSIPSTIGKLNKLRQLSFSHTKLESSIPPELYLSTTLSYINFAENAMTGTISTEIGNLRELQTLVLTNNTFLGTIPFDDLAKTRIQYLGLSYNNLEGTISQSIRDMPDLQFLYLDHNEKLVGEIPVSLGGASNLRSVNLDFTGISGRLPAVIGRLKQLEYLSIQGCKLYGSIPGEINLLSKLKTLNLVSNALTGELPNLSTLSNLVSLMLVGNEFRGRIDDKLANLRSLEFLFLGSNAFTGPIPTSIGRPAGFTGSPLKGLYLSENKLNGTIPETICDYTKLEALFLDDNHLSGGIPSCIGNLVELRQLYVFKNILSGPLPVEISALRELRGLGLEHNELVGDVSNEICDLASSSKGFDFWSDCGGTEPELSCPCCNVCCPSKECV